jgi:hypothetical protein
MTDHKDLIERLRDTAAGIEAGNTADPHGRKCGTLREAADYITALESRLVEAERVLVRLTDTVENVLSCDPDMPTYQSDYDECERRFEDARAFLKNEGGAK